MIFRCLCMICDNFVWILIVKIYYLFVEIQALQSLCCIFIYNRQKKLLYLYLVVTFCSDPFALELTQLRDWEILPITTAAHINHETLMSIYNYILTIFKWKMRNLRLNLKYLSFFCSVYYQDPIWQWLLMARTGFTACVHCDLDLGDMTLGQGHDTPLGNGKQLCEILSRSNLAVRSYGPGTDFRYMCTVTLTSDIWPWIKVMTHPWVMNNNCVKYYPDPTWQWGVMAWTRISSTSMCTVSLTLEIWPWVKVMTHPWVMDNNCVKLYPDRSREYAVMARSQCEQKDRQTDNGQTGWLLYTPQLCSRGA